MKKLCAGIVGFALSGAFAFGGPIIINNATSFTYTQNFSALGNATVTWDDGNTIQGIYLNSVGTGVPESVNATTGGTTTAGAYNMGLSGDADRALGWLTNSGTGNAYTGIQFLDQTGINAVKTISYSFVLEQWNARTEAAETLTLEYKVHTAGGNNLTSADWTTLGTAVTPVTLATGESAKALNGNENQFTIAGTTNISISDGEFLTFRLVDLHASGRHMVGIDSISITVIPEPSTWALLAGSLTFIVLLRRRRLIQ
jgi:hypothetical protein